MSKTSRAISSRWEEQREPDLPDDSKTSAFFAYLAVKRNCVALQSYNYFYGETGDLLPISQQLCDILEQEFFPKQLTEYKEWGCEYLDEVLKLPA